MQMLEEQILEGLSLIPRDRWFPEYVEFREGGVDRKGRGLFTRMGINKGEEVAKLGGVLVHVSQVPKYLAEVGNYGPQVHDEWYISPASKIEVATTGAINHGCDANVGMKSPLEFVAMKDIKAGSELLTDYAVTGMMKEFECSCKNSCRVRITNNDWNNSDLQNRYSGYFSPYRSRLINPYVKIDDKLTLFLDSFGKRLLQL